MNIVLCPLDQIQPYPGNPRHNDQAVDAVARSIAEFGFQQPLVLDEHKVIIVGEVRYKAAQKLGLTEVPVRVVQGAVGVMAQDHGLESCRTGRSGRHRPNAEKACRMLAQAS